MSILSTGKIYFAANLRGGSYDDMAFFIQEKANKNKIGVNLGTNISNNAKTKYKLEISSEKWMIFELTEAPWYCHCENLFAPVRYDTENKKCLGIELAESHLPSVQMFLENVLGHEAVSGILFELENCYALPEEFVCYEIRAKQFCETINDAYKNTDFIVPAAKIKIAE